jgi:hypothetical protein
MTESILERVVRGIAEAENVTPLELPVSIERYVSTDAIRELVDHDNDSWRLRFETRDLVAEITGNDAVRVDGEPVEPLS